MKTYFFDGKEWIPYLREILKKEEAYKFVGWTDLKILLVFPDNINGKDFYHKNGVEKAEDAGLIEMKCENPDVKGAISVDFGNRGDNRICLWRSQTYGSTSEEFRPQVREALGLEDFVYRD